MKVGKTLLPLLLMLIMVAILLPARVEASSAVQLYLNGKKLNPEVAPQIVNEVTIVPLRIITDSLGAKLTWTDEGQHIKLELDKMVIELQVGNEMATTNGAKEKLEAKPVIVSDKTLVPVRFISEKFGYEVGWDNDSRTVSLTKEKITPTPSDNGNSGNGAGTGTGNNSGTGSNGSSGSNGSNGSNGAGGGTGSSNGGTTGGSKPSGPITIDPSIPTLAKVELVGEEVVIQASTPISPKISLLSGPERIIIDLPNLSMTGSPLTALFPKGEIAVKDPIIQKIRFAQNSPTVVRVVLDLSKKSGYKLTEDKATNTIKIQMVNKRYKVVIDAGHGGSDPGAIAPSSRHEKEFTLAMEQKVIGLLKQMPDIEVYETRSDDTYPTLQERVDLANKLDAGLFISIHANKFSNPSVNGTETYYNRNDSIDFAKLVHQKMMDVSGLADRGVRNGDFKVIRETKMPAVLLEVGYLSNKNDEALLFSEEFQNRIAGAIADAVKQYFTGS
ncbi:MAG: hypothetical protein K0R67_41 [Paenibacillus sp.]|nr:hypothetical protein [Paenibacillus sp.]